MYKLKDKIPFSLSQQPAMLNSSPSSGGMG